MTTVKHYIREAVFPVTPDRLRRFLAIVLRTEQTCLPNSSYSHGIIQKFAYLLGAFWVREALRAIFVITLARQSAATYGEFILALSIGQILLFVTEGGFNPHLVTLLLDKERNPSNLLAQVSFLKAALLLVGSMAVFAFVYWQDYSQSLKLIVFTIGIGVGLEALASSFFVACQVQGRQDAEGKVKSVAAAFGFGYALTMLFAGASPLLIAFFKIIETLTNLGGAMLLSLKNIRLRLQWPQLGDLWTTGRDGTVFTLMAVATILYNKANLFFLQRYAGAEGVAQYSVTWEMVDGVSSLVTGLLLRNVLYPLFVNLWERDRGELGRLVHESSRWLLAVSIPVMFILAVESDRILPLLYGSGYPQAVWMQKYLVFSIPISFLHNLAAYLMISMKRLRLLLGIYLAGLFFNLVFCSMVIPAHPLMGTILAILLTKGGVAVATISFCQLRFGLFSARPLLNLMNVLLLGGTLYLLGSLFTIREFAEALAIAPTLALAFIWWRQLSGVCGGKDAG